MKKKKNTTSRWRSGSKSVKGAFGKRKNVPGEKVAPLFYITGSKR